MTTTRELCRVLATALHVPGVERYAARLVRRGLLPRAGCEVSDDAERTAIQTLESASEKAQGEDYVDIPFLPAETGPTKGDRDDAPPRQGPRGEPQDQGAVVAVDEGSREARRTPTDQKIAAGAGTESVFPLRTFDTLSDAIALSSPSGRMSKRAKAAEDGRLRKSLFGEGLERPTVRQPSESERLLQHAERLPGRPFRQEAHLAPRTAPSIPKRKIAPLRRLPPRTLRRRRDDRSEESQGRLRKYAEVRAAKICRHIDRPI